jgi:L-threonylcarbamoyladenylate synthase
MAVDVREAVRTLQEGGIVAFPTETLWSLSCGAFDEDAVQKIFEMKGRPEGIPLAVGCHSWRAAQTSVLATPGADALATKFLPGPLSIVLPRRDPALANLAPGFETLSIRVPDNDIARRIIDAAGPLVMTSANPHGAPDPITADEVRAYFPDLLVVGDEVPGMASTVVDGTTGVVLREGVISKSEVANAWP